VAITSKNSLNDGVALSGAKFFALNSKKFGASKEYEMN